jgi:uncharacterized RDD family membrane protein YckC
MTPVTYPRLIKRVKAFMIDSLIIPIACISTLYIGAKLGVSNPYAKAILLVTPILILEPLIVAFTGGTVGHHLLNIRVSKNQGNGNINIFSATLRFVIKLLLGWYSFIFVLTTTRHQAVHDLLARSIVIHKDPTKLPASEVLSERTLDTDTYIYPAAWRRVGMIILYWLLTTVAINLLFNLLVPDECISAHRCTTSDFLLDLGLTVIWIIALGWLAVRGWGGRLYGSRRQQRINRIE